jgi:nitrogen fixation NifU-like protein
MSEASGLYQQLVLDHQRAPRNYGALPDATHHADGANALCGDHLHMQARCADGHIQAVGFTARACAITTAAASMLSERANGFDAAQLQRFEAEFADFLRGESSLDPTLFGDLAALAELQRYPARRRCALLPFATLRAALAGATLATTEKDTP